MKPKPNLQKLCSPFSSSSSCFSSFDYSTSFILSSFIAQAFPCFLATCFALCEEKNLNEVWLKQQRTCMISKVHEALKKVRLLDEAAKGLVEYMWFHSCYIRTLGANC